MGYKLKNARNGKSLGKIPRDGLGAEGPWHQIVNFMAVRSFGKFRGYPWKVLPESKVLLSNKFFHTSVLNFLKFKAQTWPL